MPALRRYNKKLTPTARKPIAHLIESLAPLKEACARTRTYLWMLAAILSMATRTDNWGVTSWVRALGMQDRQYHSFLNILEGDGIDLDKLTMLWTRIVVKLFKPVKTHGYTVVIGDGKTVAKEGRKMPGVKTLHQESQNNSKPPYIRGHMLQALGVLVKAKGLPRCVPIVSRIHDGIKRSPSEKGTLPSKMAGLVNDTSATIGRVLGIFDAYYANKSTIDPLVANNNHVLVRVKHNAVANRDPVMPPLGRRGRKPKYGDRVVLSELWDDPATEFQVYPSPIPDEEDIDVHITTLDLLWRPLKRHVRFFLVDHPRGQMIMLTTLLELEPTEALRLYSHRFQIEFAFKQAQDTVGAYSYRMWLARMKKTGHRPKTQYTHRETPEDRKKIMSKFNAYERHIQLACIAQGVLLYFALNCRQLIFSFPLPWRRTLRQDRAPTEEVVRDFLRQALPEFIASKSASGAFGKFLKERINPNSLLGMAVGA